MTLRISLPKRKNKKEQEGSEVDQFTYLGLPALLIPEGSRNTETNYIVEESKILKTKEVGEIPVSASIIITSRGLTKYVIDEPLLPSKAKAIYFSFLDYIEKKILEGVLSEREIQKQLREVFDDFTKIGKVSKVIDKVVNDSSNESLKLTKERLMDIVFYYAYRNIAGNGILQPLLWDNEVEDISCHGINVPIFIWHKKYEYLPTNVEINNEGMINEIILKMVYSSGKTISIASPMVDGMLPDGSRFAATFRNEVSNKGSTFVVRKFMEDPITIIDLIKSNIMSSQEAAYLWLAIELKMPFLVMGVTGAGKTTVLNALLNLVKESHKVVTIEDIPELRLAKENWTPLVARPAYGEIGREIGLMDLVKHSLRYRPDIIVIGEIRGAEAFVLFQAISTGHGGATTLHAYDVNSAVKRLLGEPMNIPSSWVPLMNIWIVVRRMSFLLPDGRTKFLRRIVSIEEMKDIDDVRRVANWDSKQDSHSLDLSDAYVLKERLKEIGVDESEAEFEIEKRSTFLKYLVVKGMRDYKVVREQVLLFSRYPERLYKDAKSYLEGGNK